jgi:hypothetical protein
MRTTVPSVRTIVFICALLFSFKSFSQSIIFGGRNEIGIGIGPSFFLGDLGGNLGRDVSGSTAGGLKHLDVPLTKFAKGAFIAVYPKHWLGFRLGINHTVLEGDDAQIPVKENGDEQFRRYRNLNFKSHVLEGHLLAEIYPLGFLSDEETNGLKPYVLVGVGAFKFNPKARYFGTSGDEWVALQPLRTEGQGLPGYEDRKPYSLIGKAAQIGGGFKYYFGGNKFVGMEVLYRSPKGANKDYLDDVSTTYVDPIVFQSLPQDKAALATQLYFREDELTGTPSTRTPGVGEQRGDPKEGDSFFTSIIRFGWVLPDPNSPSGRQARQMRCPSFY